MRITRLTAAVAGAAVLFLAACSSSGGSGGGSTGAANSSGGSSAGKQPTGSAITIMQIVSGQGAGFAGFPHTIGGAKAAAAAINASGGVAGHKLVLKVCDDQFQPNKALACGRQAVTDKVSAVVGAYSGLGDNWMPALTKAGIPCIGCAGYSQSEGTSPMFFPIGISGAASVIGEGVAACALGAKKPALVYVGHAAGAFLAQSYNTGLKACGEKATEISIDQGAADFTAQATQASTHDLIQTIIGQPDIDKFKAAVAQTGKTPLILDAYENANSDYYKAAPALNTKTYVQSAVVPAYTDDPSVKQFNSEIDKYGDSDAKNRRTESTEVAWAAVHITAMMLAKAPATDAASLVKYMKTQADVKFGPTPGVNWTTPIASFKPLVVYSTKLYIARVTGTNKMVPAFTGGFFDISKKPTLAQ